MHQTESKNSVTDENYFNWRSFMIWDLNLEISSSVIISWKRENVRDILILLLYFSLSSLSIFCELLLGLSCLLHELWFIVLSKICTY